ncbi:MAG: DUF5710 domain-containing protein [Rhodocyclaceae bacterium]|nr:DUF5710 domain-containing protein [Rhodocyclaceae bacterium]MDZ4216602.1 DUF5710 domain-containing protein [Rhodocyclaceae bacterium]
MYGARAKRGIRQIAYPFAEKYDAKKLGAQCDVARKVWYIENKDVPPPCVCDCPPREVCRG